MQGGLSPFFELGFLIPEVLSSMGHNVISLPEGYALTDHISENDKISKEQKLNFYIKKHIHRVQQNNYMLNSLLPNLDIDIFISFIGEFIPLDLVKEMSRQGVITINWDENDPYPDDRVNNNLITFWKKARAYDVIWGAQKFTPNWLPLAAYSKNNYQYNLDRNVDFGFIGNSSYITRKIWLRKLFEILKNHLFHIRM